jgi:hypothetical protein
MMIKLSPIPVGFHTLFVSTYVSVFPRLFRVRGCAVGLQVCEVECLNPITPVNDN